MATLEFPGDLERINACAEQLPGLQLEQFPGHSLDRELDVIVALASG